jgi:hypothetical protein
MCRIQQSVDAAAALRSPAGDIVYTSALDSER